MLTLSEAAEQLGISRAALDNWIKRLGIEKKKEGRIGLTAKEVEQIRKQRRTNSRRRDTNTTATNSSSVVSAFVEQELKELKQIREQLQGLSEERLQWQEERLQYLEREARFVEIQRRADWLQEQLDSNSREKTELLKQAAQFQQLLLQKERSLQRILEEKQELQQRLQLLGEQALSETSEEEDPSIVEEAPSVEHEEELLVETQFSAASSIDASAEEKEELEIQEELNNTEEVPEHSVELEDDEADLLDELEAQVARCYLGFGEDRQSLEAIASSLSIPVSEVRRVAGRAVLKIRSYHLQLRQSGPSVDA